MTATLIGTTGLTGSYLLKELLDDPFFDTVRVLIRRPMDLSHPKLEKKLVDFNDGDSVLVAISNSDVIFCTVGTTQRKVKGDKDAYRKVDFDIPVNLARFSKLTGCEKFILVSSLGADHTSNNFYLKLKGETEHAVMQSGLSALYILRPSMLLGDRKESRPGEKIGKVIMTIFSFLIPSKYKAIHAGDVARAMVYFAKKNEQGTFIIDNKMIKIIVSTP